MKSMNNKNSFNELMRNYEACGIFWRRFILDGELVFLLESYWWFDSSSGWGMIAHNWWLLNFSLGFLLAFRFSCALLLLKCVRWEFNTSWKPKSSFMIIGIRNRVVRNHLHKFAAFWKLVVGVVSIRKSTRVGLKSTQGCRESTQAVHLETLLCLLWESQLKVCMSHLKFCAVPSYVLELTQSLLE